MNDHFSLTQRHTDAPIYCFEIAFKKIHTAHMSDPSDLIQLADIVLSPPRSIQELIERENAQDRLRDGQNVSATRRIVAREVKSNESLEQCAFCECTHSTLSLGDKMTKSVPFTNPYDKDGNLRHNHNTYIQYNFSCSRGHSGIVDTRDECKVAGGGCEFAPPCRWWWRVYDGDAAIENCVIGSCANK